MVSILTHSVKNASTIFAKFILSICRIRSILRQNPATQRFGGAIPLVSLYWAISAFHLSPLIIIGIGTQELHGRLEVRLEPVRQAHPIGIKIAEVKIPATPIRQRSSHSTASQRAPHKTSPSHGSPHCANPHTGPTATGPESPQSDTW